jgi:hypothetical protein
MGNVSAAAVIRAAPERSFVRVSELPGSAAAARKAAARAVHDGLLVRVHRGLYYRGRLTRYGVTFPRAEDVVREVLGTRGVGLASYSAARAWGVTTQVPFVLHVATLRTVKPIAGVKQHARKNLARVDLNPVEIALLELLRAPEVFVEAGWDNLVANVGDAVAAGRVRLDVLAEAVPGENCAVRDNYRSLTCHDSP